MQLPEDFRIQMTGILGERSDAFLRALDEPSQVSVRLNSRKASGMSPVSCQKVPWCDMGAYLDGRPQFTFDPLLHAGLYYVQEASSMFLSYLVRTLVTERSVALDLCAAPGGKSTILADCLPEGSLLVANEIMHSRCQVLAENITKWGSQNVIVTENDSADFSLFTDFFDFLLVDAPCSGEGMFRKEPEAVADWSRDNVLMCQRRQRTILSNILPALRPGGILIYSTCTYNTEEDEENVRWLMDEMDMEVIDVPVPPEWNICQSLLDGFDARVFRLMPDMVRGEGIFMCALRKKGEQSNPVSAMTYQKKPGKKSAKQPVPKQAAQWVRDAAGCAFIPFGDGIIALDARYEAFWPRLSRLKVRQAGIAVLQMKGHDILPCHGLAMSPMLKEDAFPRVNVDYGTALAYLRHESISLDEGSPLGIVLVCYEGSALGFAKSLPSRCNNMYPQNWRIKTTYLPESKVQVISRDNA